MGENERDIKLRIPFGLQRAVAAKCGVSESYVSRILRGQYIPRTARGEKAARRVRVAIARAQGKRVDDLFPQSPATSEAA